MKKQYAVLGAAVVGAISLAGGDATAGPEWTEMAPDAGRLPGSAQMTFGVGPIAKISGKLKGFGAFAPLGPALGDFEDMYVINIVNPAMFSASVDPMDGGNANFDAQLWLFDLGGNGILGNNDNAAASPFASFGNNSTDGSGAAVTTAGLYLLAISGAGNDPLSPGGPIFDFALATEVSGPDDIGGSMPIDNWVGNGEIGDYAIILKGVEFAEIPAPGGLTLLVAAGALVRRRCRSTSSS